VHLAQGSRDYNVDESPDPRAVAVAEEMGVKLPEGAVARVFNCQADIVLFDLLVVMDKVKTLTVYRSIKTPTICV
jgi:protein-tyrosine-phosphatase